MRHYAAFLLISTVLGCSDFNLCLQGDVAYTHMYGVFYCVICELNSSVSLLEAPNPAWLPLV